MPRSRARKIFLHGNATKRRKGESPKPRTRTPFPLFATVCACEILRGCLPLAPPAIWDARSASGGGNELRMVTSSIRHANGIVVRGAGVRIDAMLTVIVSACVIRVPLLAL